MIYAFPRKKDLYSTIGIPEAIVLYTHSALELKHAKIIIKEIYPQLTDNFCINPFIKSNHLPSGSSHTQQATAFSECVEYFLKNPTKKTKTRGILLKGFYVELEYLLPKIADKRPSILKIPINALSTLVVTYFREEKCFIDDTDFECFQGFDGVLSCYGIANELKAGAPINPKFLFRNKIVSPEEFQSIKKEERRVMSLINDALELFEDYSG